MPARIMDAGARMGRPRGSPCPRSAPQHGIRPAGSAPGHCLSDSPGSPEPVDGSISHYETGACLWAPPTKWGQETRVDAVHVYHDFASGVRDDRPGLDSCLRALRTGDVLVVWKLDRLGRTLAHLVNTVQDLSTRDVGLRVLTGQGAQIDTTTAAGRLVFGIFAALAEFERELIRERTRAGLTAARARGRNGGRTFALSKAQVRLAQAAMAHRDTSVSALCRELGIRPVTLYRYVGPQGELREQGEKVLAT